MLVPTPQFLLIMAVPVVLLAGGLGLRLLLPKSAARLLAIVIHVAGVLGAVFLMGLGFHQMGATADAGAGADGFGGVLYAASGVGLLLFATMLSRVMRP